MEADIAQVVNLLESDQIITVRWLALTLGITLQQTQNLLKQFVDYHNSLERKRELRISYLVSGVSNSGAHTIIVVHKPTDEAVDGLQKVLNREIYAIRYTSNLKSSDGDNTSDSASISQQLPAVDISQAQELSHSNSDQYNCNRYGGIILPQLQVSPAGKRLEKALYTSKGTSSSASESAEEHMSRMFKESTVQPKNKSNNVGNFFSKTSSSDSKTSKQEKKTTENPQSSEESQTKKQQEAAPPVPAAAPTKAVVSKDDEEEEWDDGSNIKPKNDSKRKRDEKKEVKDDSTKENNLVSVQDEDDDNDELDIQKKKSKSKKAPVVVKGAMDDFVSDANSTREMPSNGKRTKRKLVEKV